MYIMFRYMIVWVTMHTRMNTRVHALGGTKGFFCLLQTADVIRLWKSLPRSETVEGTEKAHKRSNKKVVRLEGERAKECKRKSKAKSVGPYVLGWHAATVSLLGHFHMGSTKCTKKYGGRHPNLRRSAQ